MFKNAQVFCILKRNKSSLNFIFLSRFCHVSLLSSTDHINCPHLHFLTFHRLLNSLLSLILKTVFYNITKIHGQISVFYFDISTVFVNSHASFLKPFLDFFDTPIFWLFFLVSWRLLLPALQILQVPQGSPPGPVIIAHSIGKLICSHSLLPLTNPDLSVELQRALYIQ